MVYGRRCRRTEPLPEYLFVCQRMDLGKGALRSKMETYVLKGVFQSTIHVFQVLVLMRLDPLSVEVKPEFAAAAEA